MSTWTRTETDMIIAGLHDRAGKIRREAASRKWAGPQHAEHRRDLRAAERMYRDLAIKVATQNGATS